MSPSSQQSSFVSSLRSLFRWTNNNHDSFFNNHSLDNQTIYDSSNNSIRNNINVVSNKSNNTDADNHVNNDNHVHLVEPDDPIDIDAVNNFVLSNINISNSDNSSKSNDDPINNDDPSNSDSHDHLVEENPPNNNQNHDDLEEAKDPTGMDALFAICPTPIDLRKYFNIWQKLEKNPKKRFREEEEDKKQQTWDHLIRVRFKQQAPLNYMQIKNLIPHLGTANNKLSRWVRKTGSLEDAWIHVISHNPHIRAKRQRLGYPAIQSIAV